MLVLALIVIIALIVAPMFAQLLNNIVTFENRSCYLLYTDEIGLTLPAANGTALAADNNVLLSKDRGIWL